MKRIFYSCGIITAISLSGCCSIPYDRMFPAHFSNSMHVTLSEEIKAGIREADLPDTLKGTVLPIEVEQALPDDMAIALYTGYGVCIGDPKGWMRQSILGRSFHHSRSFKILQKSFRERGQIEYTMAGYPDYSCFRPKSSAQNFFDEQWFGDWERYLTEWQAKTLEQRDLKADLTKISEDIGNKVLLLQDLAVQLERINGDIKAAQVRLDADEQMLANLKKALSPGAALGLLKNTTPPPFEPKIPYDPDIDPFLDVPKYYLEDVSGRPWVKDSLTLGPSDRAVPYLDPEMAVRIDALYLAVEHPERTSHIQKAMEHAGIKGKAPSHDDIKSLKESAKLTHISVRSCVRTPWKQATVKAAPGAPKAKYYGTPHLFGQTVDIHQPYAFDSPEAKAFKDLLTLFELGMPVKDDRVHVGMAKQTEMQGGRALAMARAYGRKAKDIKDGQLAEKSKIIFAKGKLTEQQAKLAEDVGKKQKEVEAATNLFSKISAQYINIEREISTVQAALEAQRKAKEEQTRRGSNRDSPIDRDFPRYPHNYGSGGDTGSGETGAPDDGGGNDHPAGGGRDGGGDREIHYDGPTVSRDVLG